MSIEYPTTATGIRELEDAVNLFTQPKLSKYWCSV